LRAEGKLIGRPKGVPTDPKYWRLHRHDAYIRRALAHGERQCDIIRHLHTNRSTLRRYIQRFIEKR
jgi:DNA invertase Pin-like site-specific DNA recombinase